MTAPLRVLLVAYSEEDARQIVRVLQRGYREVASGRVEDPEAMRAALTGTTWDVVLSEWSTPRFSAPEALAVMKELALDLPVIIVSGAAGEETAVEAMRAGAHDYVLKDRLARLLPAVEREIREREVRVGRRRTEEALRANEKRCRRMIEIAHEGVWLIDADAKTTFINAQMARMLGCDPEDVVGRSPVEFLDEEGSTLFTEHVARRRRAGGSEQVEVKFIRRDGATLWAILGASPLFDAAGLYEGELAMVMDITDRKKAEASLRVSETRFRRLWDSGIVLIAISDFDGPVRDVNEAGARMLGYSRQEMLARGLAWRQITPPEWQDADAFMYAQLKATGVATPWEKEVICKDGSRVSVLAGAAMLNATECIAIAVDLSRRKRAEEALRERGLTAALVADVGRALTQGGTLRQNLQRCTEAMVEHLEVALARVWTLNPAENVLELQASAGLYTHIDGAHGRIAVGRLEVGRIAERQQARQTNDVVHDSEVEDPEWARREGLVAFAGYPLVVGGELLGVMAMFSRHPLSEARCKGLGPIADELAVGLRRGLVEHAHAALEAQLRQAQKMEIVGRLAGGVAHDFNNLLSVILGYSELIAMDLGPDDPRSADVAEVVQAARRATGLTQQLLAFSRQQVLRPRLVDLNEIVIGMEKLLRRLIGDDVDLRTLASPTLSKVRVDPGQIEQVVMNLAVNARDAMPQGGTLTIETADVTLDTRYAATHPGVTPGPHVMLAVRDNGVGMDRATRARIFEPFFTTKEAGKGTGLGLSTVFGIVKQSGGSICVDSEPGHGATFTIHLPVAEGAAEAMSPSPDPAPPRERESETILLVEDDDQVRAVARRILLRSGYVVLDVASGEAALALVEQHPGAIDLLIADVVMPRMNGLQLADRLRAVRPALRVLYMSGYTENVVLCHEILEPGFAFLQKPMTPTSLVRKVREVLDGALPH